MYVCVRQSRGICLAMPSPSILRLGKRSNETNIYDTQRVRNWKVHCFNFNSFLQDFKVALTRVRHYELTLRYVYTTCDKITSEML